MSRNPELLVARLAAIKLIRTFSGVVLPMVFFAVLGVPSASASQREYFIGPSVNVVSGIDNAPRSLVRQDEAGYSRFYGVYPSLSMLSTGANSTLRLSYSYGSQWVRTNPEFRSESHAASIATSRTGRRWDWSLRDTFSSSSDLSSFDAFRGVITPLGDFEFIFDPINVQRESRNNSASTTLGYRWSTRSTLSFNAGHALRVYSGDDTVGGRLSDQHRFSGGVRYSNQATARDSWSVEYQLIYSVYGEFSDTRTHSGSVGYTRSLGSDVSLSISAGPSWSSSEGSIAESGLNRGEWGYNASVSLTKSVEDDTYTLFASQASASQTGLGGTSESRRAGIAVDKAFGPIVLFLDASVFETRGILGNGLDSRGVLGAATLGHSFADDRLSVRGGAQYQRYDRTAVFDFSQRRYFPSEIRLSL